MSQLSVSERQLLLTIGQAQEHGLASDKESLEHIARTGMFTLLDWVEAFDSLIARGLLVTINQQYFLTEPGEARWKQVEQEPYWPHVYDEYYARANDSRAHAALCERVYGCNLCQHGLMDMEQLEKLMEVLRLNDTNRVLELGCGNGFVTEYISDATGAHITGIDISRVGIEQAQQRTRQKQHRLDFRVRDINDIDYSIDSFDTVVAIDTIYWADADRMIRRAKEIVGPAGQMGIFYTRFLGPDGSQESLHPQSTPLAQVLAECGLTFETWDFCSNEDVHWQKKMEVLIDLQQEFAREESDWLFHFRLNEAAWVIEGKPRRSRYLYHVRP